MKKLLTPLVLSAVLGTAAYGSTVTFGGLTFGPIQTDLGGPSDFVAVPKFNAALLATRDIVCPPGATLTLNSVKLVLSGQISALGSVHNKNTNDLAGVTVTFAGPFTLAAPGGNLVANPSLSFGPIALTAGQTKPFGPSGIGALATNFPTTAAFLGAGNLNIPVTSAVTTVLGGSSNIELLFASGEGVFGTAVVDVTYDYTCDGGGIPEPKVYGLIGAALSLGVLGYRQYRSKKA